MTSSKEIGDRRSQTITVPPKKGPRFWLIFASMCTCLFLSALELASISTALPTIANDLHASQYTWVGTAYALASTAFLPMSGGLAQTFGRRPVILVTIVLFAIGSGICGAANSMNMLIIGRTVQGLGGGGIQSLTDIVLADLVTLQERGLYSGLYGVTWCLAASIGPVVGGVLATKGQWRWLFYLNLPITLIACISVIILLDLPIPPGNYRDKLMRMDWIGNFLVIASTTASTIGLTWGGVNYPWNSKTILFLLVIGLLGLGLFMAYESTLAKHPLVPFSILKNMTSISGYIQTFCCLIIVYAVVYCFPVYYQACKGTSPSLSGVYLLTMSTLAPAAILSGISVKTSGRYRPQTWVGWALTGIALGVMSRIHANEPLGTSFGCLALLGLGIGMLCATSMYPIQAPLPVTQNAPALAFMWFLRAFAAVWGITIGTTVLQNELAKRLPASFVQSVPQGTAIMYALIPELSTFPPQTLAEVRVAFADSLAVLWRVLAGVCGGGFLVSLLMKGVPLHNNVDEDWAFKVKKFEEDFDIENVDPMMSVIDIAPIRDVEKASLADDAKVNG
ncbi:major facilitator superfamily domain-containing protein [Boletus edulis BED1]|uniref:Major facilitator superfamily domain-containing protein n=1 Tax=Boletus edulis BED1 TaxID=1328754 RepID=A0AAD4GHD2_BOLED|nr:major facilitator superfamily domain-containing protein [Boletus edulis BED1]